VRLSTILLAATFAANAIPAFSPFIEGGSCGGSGNDRFASVKVSAEAMTMEGATVTGAPYSARKSTETARVPPDGARQDDNRRAEPEESTWRDSAGRTRTEEHEVPGGRTRCRSFLVMITDPVAGYAYALDTVNRMPTACRYCRCEYVSPGSSRIRENRWAQRPCLA